MKHSVLSAIAIVIAGVGCSDGPAGDQTHPVTGVVTYQGQPEAGVVLTFFAQVGGGVNAQAVTDGSGEFTVSTSFDMGRREQPGMVAGSYRVTASKLDKASFTANQAAPKDLLPTKYARPQSSDLSVTVVADQENHVTFELK